MPSICISIVSHNQGTLLAECLLSLTSLCVNEENISLVITFNVAGERQPDLNKLPWSVKVCENESPLGFGANHNRAFFHHGGSQADYFCVLNPDIVFQDNPFPPLLSLLAAHNNIGVVAPLLFDSSGRVQDNGREFPTLGRIAGRVGRRFIFVSKNSIDNCNFEDERLLFPEWVAGMFMLFPTHVYKRFGGFDEKYFMYCEDVDLCWRMYRAGLKTALLPCGNIVHNPRRASWKDLRHLFWHGCSMIRFLCSSLSCKRKEEN